jgi:hypothetical protein
MTPPTEDKSDQPWLEATRPVVDSWVKPTMTAPLSPLTVFRRRYGPVGRISYLYRLAVQAGGSSGPATQRPIRSRASLIVSEARLVVGKEDLGNKITPGAHPGLGKYVPQVSLHGV